MSQARKPLTARSVVASTLLGVDPPRLPARMLVRSGELFGIGEGATRVALSRMVAAGEVVADDGGYRLSGHLLDRQARQTVSRRAERLRWDGSWELALVGSGERRTAAERGELRRALTDLRLAELREGAWLRPANLPAGRSPESRAIAGAQCIWVPRAEPDPAPDPAGLWDLDAWAKEADELRRELDTFLPGIEGGDTDVLGPAFVVAAAALRHFQHDPLLPDELVPRGWPGDALREEYERFDASFKRTWRAWFSRQ